jgi:hypothetical protein
MSIYEQRMHDNLDKLPEDQMEKLCNDVDKLLGGDGDHQNGETFLKANLAVYHLVDRMIHSDGLRRAIISDFGGGGNEDIAKDMLYLVMLVSELEKEEIDEIYKALDEDRKNYEPDDEDEE